MVLSDGNGRCFDCQSEWDPNNLSALPRTPARVAVDEPAARAGTAPPAAPVVDEVGSDAQFEAARERLTADVDADADRMLAELIGASVVLEGGQMATIRAFPDKDHAVVELSDLSQETVDLDVILRSIQTHGERAPEVAPEVAPIPAPSPDDVFMLSGLILRMGVASIVETDDGDQVGRPPAGWLPYSFEVAQLVEAASAVAVARLIIAY